MKPLHCATRIVVSLLALAAPSAALAQTDTAAPATQSRTTDTPLDRFGIVDGAQLQFSSEFEDEKLTLGVELPTGASQEYRFSLVASRPLGEDEDAVPTNLDALANGTTITLRGGRFRLGLAEPDTVAREIFRDAQAACEAERRQATQPAGDEAAPPRPCTEPNYVVRTYGRRRYREYLSHLIPYGATDIGFEASVGFTDFEWVDPATFAPREERRTSWGGVGSP